MFTHQFSPSKKNKTTLRMLTAKVWQIFTMLVFLTSLVGMNPTPVYAAGGWTAYNDLVYRSSDQYIGANVTTFTIGSSNPGPTSGVLLDQATGTSTGVTATLTESGGVVWQPDPATGGHDPAAGTDAYNTFHNIADMTGVVYYAPSAGWYVDLTFTGLDAAKQYTFTTSAVRAGTTADYDNRFSQYTISDNAAATNASSAGVNVVSNESVWFNTGKNDVDGYVASWINIQPGSDGDFKVRAECGPGCNSGYKAYAFDVFMLQEQAGEPPVQHTLTVGTVGNGGVTLNPAGGTYNEGSSVTLTPVADPGWEFDSWSGANAGDLVDNLNGTWSITMNADKAVTATFTELPLVCYGLTLGHTGNGTTPTALPTNSTGCSVGQYVSGEAITLSGAAPDSGWYIQGWTGTSNNSSTASTNSLTMPASAHSAGVTFVESAPSTLVCENFNALTVGTRIGTSPGWTGSATTSPLIIAAPDGVASTQGLGTGGSIFNWSAHPFLWTDAGLSSVTFQMDFQTNASGTFDDDRLAWMTENTPGSSQYNFGIQLDPAGDGTATCPTGQNIETYWRNPAFSTTTRIETTIACLPTLTNSGWYRAQLVATKLTNTSAKLDVTLTALDASGNPGAVVASGSVPDTSTWSGGAAPAGYFSPSGSSTALYPSYKNHDGTTGNADNTCYEVTTGAPSPTITITGTPLSAFSSQPGVPSTQQGYSVSGSNLTANIGITAPADFEISTTSGSGYTSSLTLTQSGGAVAVTPIYVRFNRATAGTSNGNITHTSAGATPQNVAVSGTATASGTAVTFAAFGDYGSNSANEQAVATMVDGWNPDFIITTGDNSYTSTPIDDNIGKYYSDYIGNYVGSYGSGSVTNHFFPAMGNHDYTDGGQSTAYFSYFTLPNNERYYDFVQGPVHFFVIDSNPSGTGSAPGDGRSETSAQGTWLQAQLAASTSPWKIVYMHHPPYSSGNNHGSEVAMQWPYEAWGATAVLAGHDHVYERILRDANSDGVNLPYLTTGAGGMSLYGFVTPPVTGSQVRYSSNYGSMRVQASAASITFEFWSVAGGGTLIDTYTITDTNQTLPINEGATWKYLDTGTDQGTAWRGIAFDDSAWASGPAELGYGDGDEATLLNCGPSNPTCTSDNYTTTYFRKTFNVPDQSIYSGLDLSLLRDDGAVVYLNGTEIWRTNMPGGTVTNTTLASAAISGTDETTFVSPATLANTLVNGTNVLAVEIHQSGATSSDISFDLELTGVTAAPTCYGLTLGHTGNGTTPAASPTNSTGCSLGQYIAGQAITLSGATPDSGWYIQGWTGTTNNGSTASSNTLTMPASAHAAGVTYTNTPPALPTLPIEEGDDWRYFKGTVEPPSTWKNNGFDASSWLLGPSGFGYGDNDDGTVLSDMLNGYLSVYIRKEFTVAAPGAVSGLQLSMDFDDAFVAYLNGTEIARNNITGTPPVFNAVSTGDHEASSGDSSPQPVEYYSVDPALLVAGTNVLAIQGHNKSLSSTDLSLIPELVEVSTPSGDPVGYWRFDDGTGTTANDSSVYNNDGTVNGATWTTGKVTGALSFDGSNDRVEIPNSTSLSLSTNQVTLAGWIYPTDLSDNWKTIIQRSNTAGTYFDWQIYARASDAPTAYHPVFRMAGAQVEGDIILQTNTWYYITATYDGTALKFYIDGTLRGTTALVGATIPTSNRAIWIGGNDVWGEYFTGKIDEFYIYNQALSQAEIQALMTPITSFTVTFNSNGGSGTMSPQTANVPTALTANTFTRAGYSFSGWNTVALGGGTAYADGASYPFAADATLFAQWTALPNHTVTFNSNGGTGTMADQTTNVATALTLNTFTRSGYTFAGWNTVALGGGTAYADGASYPFAADATLFAQWTALPNHTVTFNNNGGTGTMADQTTNVATALTLNTFTRSGYTFAGWNTVALGGGTAYADGASYPFTANVTLYAQWSVSNTAPTDIALSNNSIAENQPVGSAIGFLTTTDPDASDIHTYSFCGGTDDNSFQIGGTDNSELLTNEMFDYETRNSYSICIETDDGQGGIFDKNFSISVTDVVDGETLYSLRPTFDWVDEPGATRYQLQASKYSNFSRAVVLNLIVKTSIYTPTKDLPANTTLYWRVRTIAGRVYRPWSVVYNIHTPNPPSVPGLLAPRSNSLTTDYTPVLDWRTVTLPSGTTFDHYQVQVATDTAFTNLARNESNLTDRNVSEYTPAADLGATTKFYWRVRAVNTDHGTSAWSKGYYFRTTMTPPVLSTPGEGAATFTRRPAFDWNDVPGATGYTLQVSSTITFTKIVHTGTIRKATSAYTPGVDLPANMTNLYWRVKANGVNPSAYSVGRSFSTGNPPSIPVLLLPAAKALTTDYTPRLDWKLVTVPALTTFDHYQVQVDDTADFSSTVVDTNIAGLTNHEYTLVTDLNPNTTYYWRVRSWNTAADFSGWSLVRTFRTAVLPPVAAAPSGDTHTRRPEFSWAAVTGASGYTIQVSRNDTFTLLAATYTVTTPVTTYTPGADLPANMTALYWRVRANGVNGPGLYSTPLTFSTGNPPSIPVLLLPASKALTTDYTPRLDWKPVTAPALTTFDHYQVQVDDTADFSSTVVDTNIVGLANHEYTLVTDLNPNTTYYWRVRSWNTAADFSGWSLVRTFRTVYAGPILLLPANGATGVALKPTFTWNPTAGASSYNLQVSKSSTFPVLVIDKTITTPTYTHARNLTAGTVYFWRVRVNGAFGPGNWSAVSTFTTP